MVFSSFDGISVETLLSNLKLSGELLPRRDESALSKVVKNLNEPVVA